LYKITKDYYKWINNGGNIDEYINGNRYQICFGRLVDNVIHSIDENFYIYIHKYGEITTRLYIHYQNYSP
jgi:hypothetical protein